MVVIVFGLPGSGKSYFASRLAKSFNAAYINSDQLRMKMFKIRTYSKQENEAVYNAMLQNLREVVNQNLNLVLDATFHEDESRKPFIEEMEGKGSIYFIEVLAYESIIRERLKKERPYSEADFKVYKSIQQHWEPMTESHLVLQSTNENVDEMLEKAAYYLKQEDDKRANQ